jgi:hypothetical protein
MDFRHPFHRELATPAWRAALRAFIEARAGALGVGGEGTGTVEAAYSDDRYFGPNSVVKYEFKVSVEWRRAGGPERLEASVFWEPDPGEFRLRWEHLETLEGKRAERKRMEAWRALESLSSRKRVEKLRSEVCPECGSPLRLEFYEKGLSWWAKCPRKGEHFFMDGWFKNWSDAPSWWVEYPAQRMCPKCHSDENVLGILYGLVRDPGAVDTSAWTLGGCMVSPEHWHCRACSLDF